MDVKEKSPICEIEPSTVVDKPKIVNPILINNRDPKTFGCIDWTPYLVPQAVEIPEPESVLRIQELPIFTKKSLSLLIAKAKQGKTTFATWAIARALDNMEVLWVDTEQGLWYSSRTQHWILRQAGMDTCGNLKYLDLKAVNTANRVAIIEDILSTHTFDIVVIDGIRDCLVDFNSPEHSNALVDDLMRWAEIYNCHIINVLHENKGSEHARGHLGSELTNKSEVVIRVSTNDNREVCIEPVYCRGEPFEPFALGRDADGIPYLIEGWKAKDSKQKSTPSISDLELYELFKDILPIGTSLKYGELTTRVKMLHTSRHFKIGTNKAKELLTKGKMEKWLIQGEGAQAPYSIGEYYPEFLT